MLEFSPPVFPFSSCAYSSVRFLCCIVPVQGISNSGLIATGRCKICYSTVCSQIQGMETTTFCPGKDSGEEALSEFRLCVEIVVFKSVLYCRDASRGYQCV